MDLSWVVGHHSTTFHSSEDTVSLPTRSGKAVNLRELCETTVPPCWLNPLLFNGHLQTMATALKGKDLPIYYKRKIFEAEDMTYAGIFAVDFVTAPYAQSDDKLPPRTTYFSDEEFASVGSEDSRPMLVCLHGLSGGSYELYLRECLAPLVSKTGGWEACVVNSRGCAMSKITSQVLYNARATWDIRQTMKWLRKKFPNRPFFGLGFSLGANILTNYLGEEGEKCMFRSVVVVSNPFNLDAGSLALQRSWLGLSVYSKTMGTNMRNLFETHIDQMSKNTRVDIEKVRKCKYLHEFDREVQGPTWGYPTEGAYYRDASSSDSILAIRVPYLAIHAEDDPIAVREAVPRQEIAQNPYTVLCETSVGGHLGWFELGGGRWFAKAVTSFLAHVAKEIDPAQPFLITKSVEQHSPSAFQDAFNPMRRKLLLHIEEYSL